MWLRSKWGKIEGKEWTAWQSKKNREEKREISSKDEGKEGVRLYE